MRVRPLKLRGRILASCMAATLAAMLIQLALFNASSSRVLSRQTTAINESALQNLSDDIYQRLKDIENSLISVYEHKDFLRELSAAPAESVRENYASLAYAMAFDAFDTSQNLNALYIYTLSHKLISSYRHAQTPIYTYPENIYDYSMSGSGDGVQAIVESNPNVMAVTSYYNDKRQTRLIRCVLRILENGKTPIGYMVCDVDPKGFQESLRKYRYTNEQTLLLQPTHGAALLFAAPDNQDAVKQFEAVSHALASGGSAETEGNALYSRRLRKYDLSVYSLIPLSALNANQTALLTNTLLVFALLMGAFSLLFTLISRGLTQPLTRMVATINRIKRGETTLRLPKMKMDEMGALSVEFNDMLDRIESLIATEYQATLHMNDAKYKALQMQVNPHFLYNTIDTMSAIASANNCELVATLCQALSSLFRYSIDMDEPLATLGDELRHLKNYMFIMNVRMNGGIHITTDIQADVLDTRLPRLSLQPLVENAINHGLRNKRGEKRVSIRVEREAEDLLVIIEDNGVGMEQSFVNEQLEFDPNAPLRGGHSIGLRNINARVKLLFGEPYGLSIDSRLGEGCRVTLTIPQKEDERA